ncbi:DRMIP-like protein [Schizophyllum commune]|nr:DRMIP-like protein [Schizophyllum commune Loenen D]KAI5826974.1 DRMIP-like protein [Schizophyllum commune Tattone D]
MRAAVALAALLPAAALADISINFPSGDGYWVANHSNTISWSAASNDPNVTIIVRNDQNATLNGDYDIAEYVNAASLTYTVTNVTLLPGTGYQVVFVNTSNTTQEYTRSDTFEIKPNGTTPATVSSSAPSGTATSHSGSSGSSGTQSGSGASASSTDENGAPASLSLPMGPLGAVAGLMAMSAALFL